MQTIEAAPLPASAPHGFCARLIEGNYFYPLSMVFFMLASYLLMPEQDVIGEKLRSTLQAALILQGYELLLIVSAAVIVRRLRILSDAFILLLIELLLLLDPTFFSNSFLGLRTLESTAVNVIFFALAPLKLGLMLHYLNFKLSRRAWAGFMLALTCVYLGAGPLLWLVIQHPPQAPHATYFYAYVWLIPAVALILPAAHEAGAFDAPEGYATPRQQLWTGRALVSMPLAVVIAHVFECIPVNEETLRFFPAHLAPLLVTWAILIVRYAGPNHRQNALLWADAICIAALVVSLGRFNAATLTPISGNLRPIDVEPLFMQYGLPLYACGFAVAGIYAYAWRVLGERKALYRIAALGAGALLFLIYKLGLIVLIKAWSLRVFELGFVQLTSHPRLALAAALCLAMGIAWRWRNDLTWFLCGGLAIVLGIDLLPGPHSDWVAEYFQAFFALIVAVDMYFHGRRHLTAQHGLATALAIVGVYCLVHNVTWGNALIFAVEFAGLAAAGWLLTHKGLLLIAAGQVSTLLLCALFQVRESLSPGYVALVGGLVFFGVGLVVTFNKELFLRLIPAPAPPLGLESTEAASDNPAPASESGARSEAPSLPE